MKIFQIKEGSIKYRLCENAGDLNIVRLTVLKNVIAENSAGMDFPDWLQWFSERKTFYNQSDIYGLLNHELNMARRIEQMSTTKFSDAAQAIFAIITLEDGEAAHEYDSTVATEKLQRMAEEGLTQAEVWKYTEGFILASPQIYSSFFLNSLVAHQKQQTLLEQSGASIINTPEQNQS